MEFVDPVIDIAVEPKNKAEQDKMSIALQKLAEEDPTFRVSTNPRDRSTIIAGMGELHLEIIVEIVCFANSRSKFQRWQAPGCLSRASGKGSHGR